MGTSSLLPEVDLAAAELVADMVRMAGQGKPLSDSP